jgi:response regulator RpfG family c-di-GMP phosphodiesterase
VLLSNKDVSSPASFLINIGRNECESAKNSFANLVRPLWSAILSDNSEDDTVEHVYRSGCLFVMLVREALESNPGEFDLGRDKVRWSEFFQKADAETLKAIMALHDVGKHFVDAKILTKPGKLTAEEIDAVRRHPIDGAELLSTYLRSCGALDRFQREHDAARDIAMFHHVAFDGRNNSYPAGISGADVPFHAAIASIADVIDALSFQRDYKPAWPIDKVHSYIKGESGRKFNPRAVDSAMRCWDLIQEFIFSHSESATAQIDKIWRMYYVYLEGKHRVSLRNQRSYSHVI